MFTEQIEEISDDIEQFLLTASDAEFEYWKFSPDERARLPKQVRDHFESLSG